MGVAEVPQGRRRRYPHLRVEPERPSTGEGQRIFGRQQGGAPVGLLAGARIHRCVECKVERMPGKLPSLLPHRKERTKATCHNRPPHHEDSHQRGSMVQTKCRGNSMRKRQSRHAVAHGCTYGQYRVQTGLPTNTQEFGRRDSSSTEERRNYHVD